MTKRKEQKKEEEYLVNSDARTQDRWKEFSYDKRYLDALASIFAVQRPTTAIGKGGSQNKFYLSYNESAKPTKKPIVKKIKTILNNTNEKEAFGKLLFKYLNHNSDFDRGAILIKCITKLPGYDKDKRSFTDNQNAENLLNGVKELQSMLKRTTQPKAKAKFKKDDLTDKTKEDLFSNSIKKYLGIFKLGKISDIRDTDIYTKAIRPYQDVEKVLDFLKTNKVTSVTITLLKNSKELHAESNVRDRLEKEPIIESYIGVSKLCCAVCDVVLSWKHNEKPIGRKYDHRGTHNTWKKPFGGDWAQKHFKSVIDYLSQTNISTSIPDGDTLRFSKQHRKLSTDLSYESPYLIGLKESLDLISRDDEKMSSSLSSTSSSSSSSSPSSSSSASSSSKSSSSSSSSSSTLSSTTSSTLSSTSSFSSSDSRSKDIKRKTTKVSTKSQDLLGGDLAEDTSISWISSYFGKYTLDGLSNILDLRINNLQVSNVKIMPAIFIDEFDNNLLQILTKISRFTEKTILVPINLFNKHAVGIIFEKSDDGLLKVTYFDPLNKPISKELQQLILEQFTDKAVFEERTIEQQKYSNCGPELIENFTLYLTGQRVSQEKAIELHSWLFEESLTARDIIFKTDYMLHSGSCEIEVLGD